MREFLAALAAYAILTGAIAAIVALFVLGPELIR